MYSERLIMGGIEHTYLQRSSAGRVHSWVGKHPDIQLTSSWRGGWSMNDGFGCPQAAVDLPVVHFSSASLDHSLSSAFVHSAEQERRANRG